MSPEKKSPEMLPWFSTVGRCDGDRDVPSCGFEEEYGFFYRPTGVPSQEGEMFREQVDALIARHREEHPDCHGELSFHDPSPVWLDE